jgi:hypothetical protein
MKLKEYLEEIKMTGYQFSSLMRANVCTIYSWIRQKNIPTFRNAKKIEKITKGKVPIEEFGYTKKGKKIKK